MWWARQTLQINLKGSAIAVTLGLDTTQFDQHIMGKTNETPG